MGKTFTFTSSGSWRKPLYADVITFILVGGGAAGVNGGAGVGGAGGMAGEVVEVTMPASEVPEVLTVTVGAGGASANASGGYTALINAATSAMFTAADGGIGVGTDYDSPGVTYPTAIQAAGGAGGAGAGGGRGQSTRYAVATNGGSAGSRADACPGYGSGGAGGRNSSGASSGGGSGGAGYGSTVLAQGGGTSSSGGAGAPGIVIIRVE